MTYAYSEEVDFKVGGYETSVTLCCDVKMISPGYPETGPTYSSGGEPAEGPEFECDDAYIDFGNFVAPMYFKKGQLEAIFGESFMSEFYERAQEKANEEWEEDEPEWDSDDNRDND